MSNNSHRLRSPGWKVCVLKGMRTYLGWICARLGKTKKLVILLPFSIRQSLFLLGERKEKKMRRDFSFFPALNLAVTTCVVWMSFLNSRIWHKADVRTSTSELKGITHGILPSLLLLFDTGRLKIHPPRFITLSSRSILEYVIFNSLTTFSAKTVLFCTEESRKLEGTTLREAGGNLILSQIRRGEGGESLEQVCLRF